MSDSLDPLVTAEDDGRVTVVTMRRTHKLNSISAEFATAMMQEFSRAVAAGQRAIVLRAEPGVKTWSAGHDISELPTDGQDPLTWSNSLEELLRQVRAVPVPIIGAIEGGVWGGACDLAMSIDMLVAMRTSTFAITPVKLGVPYNSAGISHFLAALPVHVVKEMFFTAEPISAERAYELGVVNRLVDDTDELLAAALKLATTISERAPLAIEAIKAEIRALTDAKPMTAETFEHVTQLRRRAWTSDDYREGIAAFSQRRSPNFTGD